MTGGITPQRHQTFDSARTALVEQTRLGHCTHTLGVPGGRCPWCGATIERPVDNR
jgi:hypothetical protein